MMMTSILVVFVLPALASALQDHLALLESFGTDPLDEKALGAQERSLMGSLYAEVEAEESDQLASQTSHHVKQPSSSTQVAFEVPAIVLTYDEHMVFATHMVYAYMENWPDNPFRFYIPYNEVKPVYLEERFGNRIKLVKTPKSQAKTVLALLDACECKNKIVYWTIDDYWPKYIHDHEKLNALMPFVSKRLSDPSFAWLALAYSEGQWGQPEADTLVNKISLPSRAHNVTIGRLAVRPISNAFIWCPGFWKGELLQKFFEGHDDQMSGKAWEPVANKFVEFTFRTRLHVYRVAEPVIVFQESTHRGKINKVTEKQLRKLNIVIPGTYLPALDGFEGEYSLVHRISEQIVAEGEKHAR